MSSGIYSITINDKVYIGSAMNIRGRWDSHRRQLKAGTHKNPYLQNAWNKYKEMSFTIVCECPVSCLIGMEQRFIDRYFDNQVACYNISRIAGSSLGTKRSDASKQKMREVNLGNVHSAGHRNGVGQRSEAFKQRMSEVKSGNTYWSGKKHSEATKKKMVDAWKVRASRALDLEKGSI